jgi:hypothetical protein
MYFFLLHLSLADILTAFFSLLPEILWTLTLPEFYGGNLLCRTMKFLQVSSSATGIQQFWHLVCKLQPFSIKNLKKRVNFIDNKTNGFFKVGLYP